MTIVENGLLAAKAKSGRMSSLPVSCGMARLLVSGIVISAIAIGFTITGGEAALTAVSRAGEDLTRLLRFMAAIKAVLALGGVGAILWRLGAAVPLPWLIAYGLACGAMSAGPGLIWSMAHVGLGALLLHSGLLCSIVLLCRDPAVTLRLEAALVRRRARLRHPTARRTSVNVDIEFG